jgi:predicted alpha/beta hydrolase
METTDVQWNTERKSMGADILRAEDAGRFALTRVEPREPARGAVVCLPGMFSGRRFWISDRGVGLAAHLAAAGFAAYLVERREIGASPRPAGARAGLDEHVRYDLPLVQSIVTRERQGPAFWMGHSFGGVMAARAAATSLDADAVAGLVLFATQFEVGKTPLAFPGNLFTRALAYGLGRFPARRLGLGPEDEPPAAIADAAHWVTRGRRRPEFRQTLAKITAPALAVVGAGDTVDPPAGCERFVGHFASTDKTFIRAGTDTGYSTDYDHPGIVVGKPAREEIWPLVLEWLKERAVQSRC